MCNSAGRVHIRAYGGAGSWAYYAYILIIGLACMTKGGPFVTRLGWGLALMAVLANKSTAIDTYRAWLTNKPTSATDGLWALPEEAIEWSQVRQMAKGHKTTVISWAGAAFLLAPEFLPRTALYLIPFSPTKAEVVREVAQISEAQYFVMRADLTFLDWSLRLPAVARALAGAKIAWKGKYFAVMERSSSPHDAGGSDESD